ncbi:MAG: lytic transglycosylase domain-containing protein [Chitinophagaceae bacterium]|nr:lytic transglycosylase domain-containing protein [Chitinophagaceae bacterium]
MMMKQKLFVLGIFCFGVLTIAIAGDDKKKKSATATTRSTVKPVSKPSKSTIKVKSTILRDTIQAPAKVDDAKPVVAPAIPDLFESATNAANGVKLNPRAVSFVQDYMEVNSKELLKMKDWGRPYFNMIDAVFTKYNLPVELKYLAVIESKLKTSAVSWVGAVGPWQFMPVTARELGLKVTRKVDERRDYYKSTHAAAKYLRDLYKEFGDWLLVIAAYNGGPGNVNSAIRKSGGSKNFWAIQGYLPNETRNHVKKFIGTHYIFEGQGGVTTLTKSETVEQISAISQLLSNRNLTAAELENVKTVKVSGKYHSQVISKVIVMEVEEFHRYNPNFDRVMATAENSYELKLPAEKMDLFTANKYQILNESVQLLLSGGTVSAMTTSISRPSANHRK